MESGSRKRWAAGILFLACVVHSTPSSGDDFYERLGIDPDSVEEFVVTGSASQQALLGSDTSSVTAFDSEALSNLRVENISDIASFTPNLEIVTAGTTSPTLFIRGIGLNDFSAAATGSIAVYQDDVLRNSSAIQLGRIFDVKEVIVLRGPQGTGPHRNATAGAIRIYPNRPSGDFGASLTASYGNYDYVDIEGMVEAPLIEDLLSIRLSGGFKDRAGYVHNRCAGAPPLDQRNRYPGGLFQEPLRRSRNDPYYSHCGELVALNSISSIQTGLPKNVNAQRNWAARTILSWTPDFSVGTEWHLNIHGGQNLDDTFVGQTIGTNNFDVGNGVNQGLGGFDVFQYRERSITRRSEGLQRHLRTELGCDLLSDGSLPPGCPFGSPNAATTAIRQQSNQRLSNELVDLDSDPWEGDYNRIGDTKNTTLGAALQGKIEVTDSIRVESITAYEQWDRTLDNDFDFSPNVAFESNSTDAGHQITQDLRLGGIIESDSVLDWELGTFFLYEEIDGDFANFFEDSGQLTAILNTNRRVYDQYTTGATAYLDLTWTPVDFLSVEAGARYNYERKEMDYTLITLGRDYKERVDNDWKEPTGGITLNFLPIEDVNFYLKYTRGFKSGTYTPTGSPSLTVVEADPEFIDAYEVGMKLFMFERRLGISAALFYYDYEDYQIFLAVNDADSPPQFQVINANSLENYGAELEMTMSPFDGLSMMFNLGWLESEFLDFTQTQIQRIPGLVFRTDIDNTGNRTPNSPRYTVSILTSAKPFEIADQLFASDLASTWGELAIRYDGVWADDRFFDASEGRGAPNSNEVFVLPPRTIGQKDYWLHGFGVDWSPADSGLKLTGWVRNLTNEAYKSLAGDASSFQGTTIYFVGEPRTYGLTISLKY